MCVTAAAAALTWAERAQGTPEEILPLMRQVDAVMFELSKCERQVDAIMAETDECGQMVEELRRGLEAGKDPRVISALLDGLEEDMKEYLAEYATVADTVDEIGARLDLIVAQAQKINDRELNIVVKRALLLFNGTKAHLSAAQSLFDEVGQAMESLRRQIEAIPPRR
jgi:chromosome segregation ATPase